MLKNGLVQVRTRVVVYNPPQVPHQNNTAALIMLNGYAIKVPPTWWDLYASGQMLLRQGVSERDIPGRMGIRAERWREICGACRVRVVALGVEEIGLGKI